MKTLAPNVPPESLPAGISWSEARLTMAAAFLEQGRVTITEGARLAGLSRRNFVAKMRARDLLEELEEAADAESSRLILGAIQEGTVKVFPWSEVKAELDGADAGD